MDNIEEYLYEHPELIEQFMKDNEKMLNEIKQRYADMLETGDLVGRFLLSKALMEMVRVTTGDPIRLNSPNRIFKSFNGDGQGNNRGRPGATESRDAGARDKHYKC